MYFLLDKELKVLIGWSAKCGCSHIKNIFYFLKNKKIDNKIHTLDDYNSLPDDIENYTSIIISRNPYKRLVSGFLDKYKLGGQLRYLWKYDIITFSKFIEELCKNDWNMIENHHFTPQTSENFDKKIMLSKSIKCYDIENIDYGYIEQLYGMKIPDVVLNKKEGHERVKNDKNFDDYVYDLGMSRYHDFNVNTKYFYNTELKKKVYNFYRNDFKFFENFGILYKNSI